MIDNNMEVTGIEISQTAINIARENGFNNKIYHGSVSDMPFENKLYDSVVSFALIHLLKEFGNYGLVNFEEIDEIYKENPDKPPVTFLMIKCRKEM